MRLCIDAFGGELNDDQASLTLDHAFALRRAMQNLGCGVYMTRVRPIDLRLEERAQLCNNEHCVAYVSLRCVGPFGTTYWSTSARSAELAHALLEAVAFRIPYIDLGTCTPDMQSLDLRFTHCPSIRVHLGQGPQDLDR